MPHLLKLASSAIFWYLAAPALKTIELSSGFVIANVGNSVLELGQ